MKHLDEITEPIYRVASHQLAIEKGRHINTARSERLCRNCNLNQIETEYHFLLICPKFSQLRSLYLKRFYYTWPTKQKFALLMKTRSKNTIRNISKFIYFANNLRN